MTSKELVLDTLRRFGKTIAKAVQTESANMTGTELNEAKHYVPDFSTACAKMNMLDRPVGFVCRSSEGRVVKLLQNYDSTIYTDEPELLPAQWGFVWSTEPRHALPFIALSTSPFNKGECCTDDGHVWRSGQDGNVWKPNTIGVSWEDLGTIEEVMK